MLEKWFGKKATKTKEVSLYAPLTGKVIALGKVPDPVFSQKIAGDGIAIEPTGNQLVAPVNAKVTQLFRTHHAIGLTTEDGLEILLHIGIDTVSLDGRGFLPAVVEGDNVKTGDLLITFERDLLMQETASIVTPMLITNMDKVESIEVEPINQTIAGENLILTLKLK